MLRIQTDTLRDLFNNLALASTASLCLFTVGFSVSSLAADPLALPASAIWCIYGMLASSAVAILSSQAGGYFHDAVLREDVEMRRQANAAQTSPDVA